MYVVTGASGHLGRLVIQALLSRQVPAGQIVAAVRSPERVSDLAALGVVIRHADYDRSETLDAAFAGAQKVLLISSSELGRRVEQHQRMIAAAQRAAVAFVAYTSVLHADASPLALAADHRETERLLADSGLAYAALRNGWYTENYLGSVAAGLQHGAVIGCANDGRISAAARVDFAEAAAVVLTAETASGSVFELAGDTAFTMAEFAALLSRHAGRAIPYVNMSQDDHRNALINAGLPAAFAVLIADADAGIARGGLFDESRTLSTLIGRPTTSVEAMIAQAVGPAA